VTTANNTPGEPADPAPSEGQRITISAKGRFKKVSTTTQSGTAQVLRGMSLMESDGFIYPFSRTLIDRSAVPLLKSQISADGKVTAYSPIDACNAARTEEQGISIKPEYVETASKLIPEQFIQSGKTSTKEIKDLSKMIEPVFKAPDAATADRAARALRERATAVRARIQGRGP
jgi:hypothetical protein